MTLWQYVFLVVNALALLLMGLDKAKAVRGAWRIRERTLFLFALCGGGLGGTVGMLLFHHKTNKWYFRWLFPLLALAQLFLLLAWYAKRPV